MLGSGHNHYLLTGGTGGLGSELIPRLLAHDPGARLTVLIRSTGAAHARARLGEVLSYVRCFYPGFDASRLEAVCGDVTRDLLGVAHSDVAKLVRSVTHVVHAAASIDLAGSCEDLRRNNLDGTRNAAGFAARCRQLQCFLMVSTAYVAGRRSGDVLEDELDRGQDFVNHYERSKFEAEAWVRAQAGRLPSVIVRPSIVVGDSRDGHTLSFQNMYMPLYYIGIGALQEVPGDVETLVDLVPIDHVVEVVARALHEPACVGNVYHACGGASGLVPFTFLMAAARRALADRREQRGRIRSTRPATTAPRALTARLAHLFSYLACSKRFSVANVARDLGEHAPRCPHPREYVPRLMEYWRAMDFGQSMPWRHARAEGVGAEPSRTAEGRC
jgi:thioester reductase-like protein